MSKRRRITVTVRVIETHYQNIEIGASSYDEAIELVQDGEGNYTDSDLIETRDTTLWSMTYVCKKCDERINIGFEDEFPRGQICERCRDKTPKKGRVKG
jgi:DNA-directed RNA polymerase subunit RPC12/RpoP